MNCSSTKQKKSGDAFEEPYSDAAGLASKKSSSINVHKSNGNGKGSSKKQNGREKGAETVLQLEKPISDKVQSST